MATYRGNCHCGDFVFEATLSKPLTAGSECNCSICHKKGYVFAFLPDSSSLKIVKGSIDKLSSYVSGDKYAHKFCATCGSAILITGRNDNNAACVNIRCFQGPVDILSLEINLYDGVSLPPPYVEPIYTGPEPTGGPTGDQPAKIYHGSCHCGAVRMSLRCKPLDTLDPVLQADRVIDCNCSICVRGGYVWYYPEGDQTAIQGEENLTSYSFCQFANRKQFCRICGVHLLNAGVPFTAEQIAALPPSAHTEEALRRRAVFHGRRNVNLRALHGVDFAKLHIRHPDNYTTMPPPYVNP